MTGAEAVTAAATTVGTVLTGDVRRTGETGADGSGWAETPFPLVVTVSCNTTAATGIASEVLIRFASNTTTPA